MVQPLSSLSKYVRSRVIHSKKGPTQTEQVSRKLCQMGEVKYNIDIQ
jgi:hypothetical protein